MGSSGALDNVQELLKALENIKIIIVVLLDPELQITQEHELGLVYWKLSLNSH